MSFYCYYPPSSSSANPSVGTNSSAIPLSSTLIGGNDAGTLIPISVDASGNINVNLASPTGLATSANQVLMLEAYKDVFTAYDFAGKVVMVGTSDGSNNVSPLYSDSSGFLIVSNSLDFAPNISVTTPTPLASSFTIAAANATRVGLKIVNDTDVKLCVLYGDPATTTYYTVPIYPGSYWNMEKPIYRGIVTAICQSTPTGTLCVTEQSS